MRLPCAVSMLTYRPQHWASIKPAQGERIVFTGILVLEMEKII